MATTNIQKFAGDVEVSGTVTGDGSGLTTLNGSQVTTGTVAAARIDNLDASKINAGTLASDRIPSLNASKITTGTLGTGRIPDLDAGRITAGTFETGRIPNLDANKITTGTITRPVTTSGGVSAQSLTTHEYIYHNGDTNTAIRFPTHDNISLVTNSTERIRVTSDGYVGIGTDSPGIKFTALSTLANTSEDSGLGATIITRIAGYDDSIYRQYYHYHRIGQGGSNASLRQFNGTSGCDVAWYNNPGARWLWRMEHDSTPRWQAIYQNTSRGYFEYNGSNAQLTFTGQHRSFIDSIPYKSSNVYEGRIVSADKNKYTMLSGNVVTGNQAITINEAVPVVSLTEKEKDKNVFGVVSLAEDPNERKENYGNFFSVFDKEEGDTRVHINSLGEGSIWVCNKNGNLDSGDYITSSSLKGYGQKQDDDVLHNYTVAKITMDCDFNPVTQPVKRIKKKPGQIKKWVKITREEISYEIYSKTDESKRDIETKTVYIDENNNEISKEQYDKLNSETQTNYTETTKTVYIFVERDEAKKETEGYELEVTDGMVNDLDENDQIQWEDTEETEKAYNIRFLDALGETTDEANSVYIGAFVGCTYHCG